MPRVSVVVSHYDRQHLLLEALDSIAAQTYRDFEVIVVNDHGADSRALVEEFAARGASSEPPFTVRYDYRPANAGVAATRNRGVALATGELIAYLDDDDLWRPQLLEGLVGQLDARPEAGLVYGDAEIWRMERISQSGAPMAAVDRWRCAAKRTLAVPFDLDELRRDDFIVPSGMIHRRSIHDVVGPFDEGLHVSDDWDWLLRAVAVTEFARLPEVVVTVRIWSDGSNLSANFDHRRRAALAEIERRHGTPPLEPKTFWEVADRPIRSASPAKLIELATGYQRSRILFALVELGVPTLLADGPRSRDQIATELGVERLVAHRFLSACASLGLLIREGNVFRNALETQQFLVRGAPMYLGEFFGRYDRASTSTDWAEFSDRLRSWRSGGTIGRDSMVAAPAGAEVRGQHRLSLLTGEALARALDLSANLRLLDLGGGTGAMSIALCQRYPELEAIVFEAPAIAAAARDQVRESGTDRIAVREGNFLEDRFPDGCDLVLLANVLSMFGAATTRGLLGRVFDYLPPGGTVVLSGWMLDDDESGPLTPVLFSLEDIVLGAPDVERSSAQYAEWLARAGFEHIERARYFDPTSFVVGRKPRGTPERSPARAG